MMIHKITSSVDYNKCLKRLDTILIESTNQKSIKVPKVVKQTNKKPNYIISSQKSPFEDFLKFLFFGPLSLVSKRFHH